MGQTQTTIRRGNEFWRLSSRNREGHKRHPLTAVRREAILIHWAAGWIEDAIASKLGIDVDTVGRHLRAARKSGDPRAAIRHAATLQAMGEAPKRQEPMHRPQPRPKKHDAGIPVVNGGSMGEIDTDDLDEVLGPLDMRHDFYVGGMRAVNSRKSVPRERK